MRAATSPPDQIPLTFTSTTPGTVTVDRDSGIISTCLFGTLKNEWITARIDGLPYDTLLLSRGSHYPKHGVLDGCPFLVEPHGTQLITYIPQGVRGEMTYFAEPNTSSLLMFPSGYLGKLIAEISDTSPKPFVLRENAGLVDVFQAIEAHVLALGKDGGARVEALSRMLAKQLAEQPPAAATVQRTSMGITPQRLKRVLSFIDDHLGEQVNLDALAEIAGLSRFYFVKVFKGATGRSPYQHLLYRRIARAQTLIARTELSLASIAEASGFASPAQFSAAFKRETGMTPSCYRDLARRGVPPPGKAIP